MSYWKADKVLSIVIVVDTIMRISMDVNPDADMALDMVIWL